jgi:hypothetical protein
MNNTVKNKVSFDFDSTLDREDVQVFAKHLINEGLEVWVTTSRGSDEHINKMRVNPATWKYPPNHDLYLITNMIGIPRERIQFTTWVDKWTVLNNKDFIWHLDDDEVEIKQMLLNNCDVEGINVEDRLWLSYCQDLLCMNSEMYRILTEI